MKFTEFYANVWLYKQTNECGFIGLTNMAENFFIINVTIGDTSTQKRVKIVKVPMKNVNIPVKFMRTISEFQ